MFVSIQYLRALAAIMVVLAHTSKKLDVNSYNPLSGYHIGEYGVDLFFIISGFIMCLTVDNKSQSFSRFMVARFIRILPLYWLLTTAALVIYIVAPSLVNSSGGYTSILSSYFLLPNGYKFLIQNGWTLSYEFFFYFIFSVFLFSPNQKLLVSITIILLVIARILVNEGIAILGFITSPLLLEFVFGIVAYKLIINVKIKPTLSYLGIVTGLVVLIFVNELGPYVNYLDRTLYAGVPMLLIFIGCVSLEEKMPKISWLFGIGMSSYSMYLLHPFALSGVTVVFKLLGIEDISGLYMSSMIVVSIVSGYLCYVFIELKIDNKIKRNKSIITQAIKT
jgi:peptidoglycan/LPS O-acetylase OafA/YrhL